MIIFIESRTEIHARMKSDYLSITFAPFNPHILLNKRNPLKLHANAEDFKSDEYHPEPEEDIHAMQPDPFLPSHIYACPTEKYAMVFL